MAPREPETVTRKPNEAVGTAGDPPVGGGHQTAEQAAITDLSPGGRSDAEREETWRQGGAAGHGPPALGGSSSGHSDRKPADDLQKKDAR